MPQRQTEGRVCSWMSYTTSCLAYAQSQIICCEVTSRCAVTDCPCEMAALFSNRGERFTVLMYVGCRSTCFTQLFKTLSVVINNSRHILVVWSSFPKFTGLTPRLNTYGDHAVPPTGVYVAVNVWRLNSNCWVLLPFQIPLGDAFP